MKKKFLSAIVLAALTFVSCKKDKAVTVTPDPGTPVKLLTKLTKKENNVTTIYNFFYDTDKRLTSYKSTDNKTGVTFTYDGNSNLIKVEETEDDFKNIYTYIYNNNIPVAADFKSWKKTAGEPDELIEDDHLVYTVANNQVVKIHLAFNLSQDAADFDLTYNNGNLSKITGSNTSYTASFGYGNKKPVFPVVSKYILDQAGFSLQFAAKNDLVSIAFDFPGTDYDKTIINQYTYDANGYVLTSNDGTEQATYEYQ